MKKKAILLLTLVLTITLFYNVVGFYLMYTFDKEQTWVRSNQNIPESDFKVLHLNASLYSFVEDSEMEYVNENVTIKNVTYHIFKKKTENNIVNLYYLRNNNLDNTTLKLEKIADSEIFNKNSSNQNPLKKMFKSSFDKYVFDKQDYNKQFCFLFFKNSNIYFFNNKELQAGYKISFYTPPKAA